VIFTTHAAPVTVKMAVAVIVLAAFGMSAPVDAALETHASLEALDECDARVRSAPRDPASYYCYLQAFRAGAPGGEAIRRLEGIVAVNPGLHRARMILGMIESGRAGPRAEQLLRDAVKGMEEDADHHGVVYGSLPMAFLLGEEGRLDEADSWIERAEGAAESSGDPELAPQVWTEQALMAKRRADYGRSLHLYRRAEEAVFPDGPSWLKGNVLSGLAWLHWYFGDLRSAMATYRRELEVRLAGGESRGEVVIRSNMAFIAMILDHRGELSFEEAGFLIDDALEAAMTAGAFGTEGRLRLLRSRLLEREEAVRECELAIDLADMTGDAETRWSAISGLAWEKIDLDMENAEEVLALIDTVVEEARAAGMPWSVANALQSRAGLMTRVGSREEAIAAWEESIDAIESIGKLQEEDFTRALTMSHWSYSYHQLIGLLLDGLDGSSDPDADLEKAFRIMERRQARSLVAILTGNDEAPTAVEGDRYPAIAEIRSALHHEEVMLIYQVAHEWEGRSWLLAITSAGVEVRELPGSRDLGDAITVFEGMIRAGDALADRTAADLFAMVTGGVLDDIMDRLRTIILIPDGPVHQLPFAALRVWPEVEPLGTGVRIDILPAAALWMRWRTPPEYEGRAAVLSLADPDISPETAISAFRGPALWGGELPLGSLPRARDEGRAVVRVIGGKSRVLSGDEASESALKMIDPSTYRLLHLAAHAVVDDARPERSAVLLAPGDGEEDGLLDVGEVARLDLNDHVVLLSACRGAAGPVIEGEGVMGLARAFLLAGARAVVANRWPYNDEDAAQLTRVITAEIGRGSSIGDALTEARRAQAASGAPVASWAGLTLIGDGGAVVVPGGNRSFTDAARVLVMVLVVAAVAFLIFVVKRR